MIPTGPETRDTPRSEGKRPNDLVRAHLLQIRDLLERARAAEGAAWLMDLADLVHRFPPALADRVVREESAGSCDHDDGEELRREHRTLLALLDDVREAAWACPDTIEGLDTIVGEALAVIAGLKRHERHELDAFARALSRPMREHEVRSTAGGRALRPAHALEPPSCFGTPEPRRFPQLLRRLRNPAGASQRHR